MGGADRAAPNCYRGQPVTCRTLRVLGTCSQFMQAAARTHPREQPHWYLAAIGVDPPQRGQGAGAALLRSRLERCDKAGTAAYLESSNPQNVPLYEHFGFQVTGALDLPKGAVVYAHKRAFIGDADRAGLGHCSDSLGGG